MGEEKKKRKRVKVLVSVVVVLLVLLFLFLNLKYIPPGCSCVLDDSDTCSGKGSYSLFGYEVFRK